MENTQNKNSEYIFTSPNYIHTMIEYSGEIDGNIKEARLMQGVTVFAKFRTLKKLEGKNIAVLAADYQELKRMNKLTRQCLLNAYKTFVDFKTQKLSASAYDTSVNVFNMPLFTKIGLMANNLKANMSKKFN